VGVPAVGRTATGIVDAPAPAPDNSKMHEKILETFFLKEEKRPMRTQNFREKQTFHDLLASRPRVSGLEGR
jgi:hypothetical protein